MCPDSANARAMIAAIEPLGQTKTKQPDAIRKIGYWDGEVVKKQTGAYQSTPVCN